MQQYIPSMSGKGYAYMQLGLSFFHDTRYRHLTDIVAIVMTQLSLKAGLKQWGDDAKIAVEAEVKQLHWRNSFKPVHWKDLTQDRRKQILKSHVFVKKKRPGEKKHAKLQGATNSEISLLKRTSAPPQ